LEYYSGHDLKTHLMNEKKRIEPPAWAQRLLSWYCRPELLEDLQGDLSEYFHRNVKSKGRRKARWIFVMDVFKFIRPYTIRKPQFLNLFIQWIMIGSYLKTSGRSILRNKLFSTINVVGLAISMSVGLLMISFLADVLSYDQFHVNRDRIYRIATDYKPENREARSFASTSVAAGRMVKDNVGGVEEVVILRRGFAGDARVGENYLPLQGLWSTETFFKIFTFPLVKGDAATALRDPYSLVLTESSAKKLFGEGDALGKSVKFDTTEYIVTGVMRDVPRFSHLQFDALVSFSTVEIQEKNNSHFLSWGSLWSNYVYVLLPENGDPQNLQANLDRLSEGQKDAIEDGSAKLVVQPLREASLGNDVNNAIGPTMLVSVVWIVGGLAFVVLLSACFNYTNLSIARSLRRSREVGIRKVIGARKGHVLGQFISEAVLISLLALVFSFLMFLVIRPQFLSIAPELQRIVTLELSFKVILYFIALAVVVGVAAGFLPALFFSRINAIQVLKDSGSLRVFTNLSMRKALIVTQYTFSLMFIVATVIGLRQYKNFLSFDLGFNTESVLNIRLQGTRADQLCKELSEMPEVIAVSKSLMVTSVGTHYGTRMKYNENDSVDIWYNSVDEKYFPLHGHKLIAGRNFNPLAEGATESEIIVNEQTLRFCGIGKGDPSKAIGETVTVDDHKLIVVGVLRDFHYGKVDMPIEPVIFRYLVSEPPRFVNAKISTTDWPATLAAIDKAWHRVDPVHPLDATFYDDQIERAYSEFSAMLKIIGFLSLLAICISSMGLLGMVVFTTETRLKEISIRKVLGASIGALIYLMSRGFIALLCISAFIALPLTYLFFDKVVLNSIAFHVPIAVVDVLAPFLGVMAIALLMIGSQTFKVARSNPAEVLKNE
jgi:putative ABC transport system permease protein